MEYCQEFLNNINELAKVITPIAIRAGLLMMLSQKMNSVSKNYEFVTSMIENIFTEFETIAKSTEQVQSKLRFPFFLLLFFIFITVFLLENGIA